MSDTPIQWTDKTWNPVRGCSIVSPGCVNCYAMKQAHRFSGEGRAYHGLTKQTGQGPQWTGKVVCDEEKLLEPLSWRKPCRVFVNSMSDLFHDSVPDAFIDRVFASMGFAVRHTFQVLTKRPERMRAYLADENRRERIADRLGFDYPQPKSAQIARAILGAQFDIAPQVTWPLPNVWLGVSCENQQTANERIPLLLQTPAAVRFISAEPLLDWLSLKRFKPFIAHLGAAAVECPHGFDACPTCDRGIDWVIVGGESGPGARRCSAQWVRQIVRHCHQAHVPVFVKQLGRVVIDRNDAGFDGCEPRSWPSAIEERDAVEDHINGFREDYQGADVRVHLLNRKGGDPAEWPEDLRVREYPQEVRA